MGRFSGGVVNKERSKTVILVGAGGNIGSHLAPHLARMKEVGQVVLIDKDFYEEKNLGSQDIISRDVGKSKAKVQALRLRQINPSLEVRFIADAVERIPVGALRGDVILACLDSRISRQSVNQLAWRLGVPLLDAGVQADSLLARVNLYVPGADSACLECAWDDGDYALLEQSYPCEGQRIAPTNAPSSLGAMAASLQAIECRKALAGDVSFSNHQVLIDARHHRHFVTRFARNPRCRFDHRVWSIEKLSLRLEQATLGDLFELANSDRAYARLESKPFVKRLTCGCGRAKRLLHLYCSLAAQRCRCGQMMMAAGFDLAEKLESCELRSGDLRRALLSVGLRAGDVISLGGDCRETHYEITDDRE
ncbi:MAG: ThiF family adenylyltransferase [Acidobacteriota bacterium]